MIKIETFRAKQAEAYTQSLNSMTPVAMFGEGVIAGEHANSEDVRERDIIILCCCCGSGATHKEKYE